MSLCSPRNPFLEVTILKPANLDVSICKGVLGLAMPLVLSPWSFIHIAIFVAENAMALSGSMDVDALK